MFYMNKFLVIVSVFVVLSSLTVLTVRPINVQTTFKPYVAEFSAELISDSYGQFLTYTTDCCTGKTITCSGHHVENKNMESTIKNQPFNGEQIHYTPLYWPKYASPFVFGLVAGFICIVVITVVVLLRRSNSRLQTCP